MATPVVALRFRDTTPDVDTIQSHLDIISAMGFVWWGWWKKTFEDGHLETLDSINGKTSAYIVDRSTRRMFTATVEVWHRGVLRDDDLAAVPKYYVEERNRIFGWFKITEIQISEYLDDIANRFGDHTLVPLDGKTYPYNRIAATTRASRSAILHLSDLHFGPDYDFLLQGETPAIGNTKKTLTDALMDDLGRIGAQHDIGTILITGDFTTKGDWSQVTRSSILAEFKSLTKALGLDRDHIVAVPGNHDIVRAMDPASVDPAKLAVGNQAAYEHELHYRVFCHHLMGRGLDETLNYVRRIQLGDIDILIGVLNSCTIVQTEWSEYGYIGDSGIDALTELGAERIDRPTFKILAMHHHLLPVTNVATLNKKGITLSIDAPRILDAAHQAGVQLALHGHEHMPRVVKYNNQALGGAPQLPPICVVSNGSTGVSPVRRPGSERNTYCVFRPNNKEMHLTMRELRSDGKAGLSLFSSELGISPTLPKASV